MVKQYLGKHAVVYAGEPDGEGCIFGTWKIDEVLTGPFLLKPVVANLGSDEILEIGE
jgi:hypothetical protein